ncbi:hypothetical protein F5Y18DRAFT_424649 [Xylariaceae sp. FL1019]|nr:hypothetical protein F5Y18DRAFT_424649 [Xylariaceae sp. FL1019]
MYRHSEETTYLLFKLKQDVLGERDKLDSGNRYIPRVYHGEEICGSSGRRVYACAAASKAKELVVGGTSTHRGLEGSQKYIPSSQESLGRMFVIGIPELGRCRRVIRVGRVVRVPVCIGNLRVVSAEIDWAELKRSLDVVAIAAPESCPPPLSSPAGERRCPHRHPPPVPAAAVPVALEQGLGDVKAARVGFAVLACVESIAQLTGTVLEADVDLLTHSRGCGLVLGLDDSKVVEKDWPTTQKCFNPLSRASPTHSAPACLKRAITPWIDDEEGLANG